MGTAVARARGEKTEDVSVLEVLGVGEGCGAALVPGMAVLMLGSAVAVVEAVRSDLDCAELLASAAEAAGTAEWTAPRMISMMLAAFSMREPCSTEQIMSSLALAAGVDAAA